MPSASPSASRSSASTCSRRSAAGRSSYAFWRRFAEIPNVVAIKIAPFNRYQTLDVVRAVADAGRDDIALYTGNDDNIVARPGHAVPLRAPDGAGRAPHRRRPARPLGGLDASAPSSCSPSARRPRAQRVCPATLLRTGVEVTDANAAFFDAANGFAGCIAGIHEVLRRQGLLTAIAASTRTRR